MVDMCIYHKLVDFQMQIHACLCMLHMRVKLNSFLNKLRNMKAPRKHSLHGKIAASVLLKLLIIENDGCHTTDAPSPLTHERNFNWKQHKIHNP